MRDARIKIVSLATSHYPCSFVLIWRNNLQDPHLGNWSIKFTVDRKCWLTKAHLLYCVATAHKCWCSAASSKLQSDFEKKTGQGFWLVRIRYNHCVFPCLWDTVLGLFWPGERAGLPCTTSRIGTAASRDTWVSTHCDTALVGSERYGRCSQFVGASGGVQGSVSHCH